MASLHRPRAASAMACKTDHASCERAQPSTGLPPKHVIMSLDSGSPELQVRPSATTHPSQTLEPAWNPQAPPSIEGHSQGSNPAALDAHTHACVRALAGFMRGALAPALHWMPEYVTGRSTPFDLLGTQRRMLSHVLGPSHTRNNASWRSQDGAVCFSAPQPAASMLSTCVVGLPFRCLIHRSIAPEPLTCAHWFDRPLHLPPWDTALRGP